MANGFAADLAGKAVLVTGASAGIGAAVARLFARAGCRVAIHYNASLNRAEEVAADVRFAADPAFLVGGDLRSSAKAREVVNAAAKHFGGLDVLVDNAGRLTGGLLEEQELDEIYAMFQVNLVAVAHLTARLLPGMLERGRGLIVNNASISGYASFPAASTYAAAKAGVVALSESLRRELAPARIEVMHLVTPGVETDMLDAPRAAYGGHMDTAGWPSVGADESPDKVVAAMKRGDHVVGPGGRLALAKLASRGPAFLLDSVSRRMFTRAPRS